MFRGIKSTGAPFAVEKVEKSVHRGIVTAHNHDL
jgi:hypothetical protein